jgi:hypothetical protein
MRGSLEGSPLQADEAEMRGAAKTVEPHEEQSPLISNRLLIILTISICVLAAASAAISWFGRAYGERLSLAGHSESSELIEVTIGRDQISVPANTIRFESQRQGGLAERLDLYLLWPDMTGYTAGNRARFDDLNKSNALIFLQISQSTMSRDMSGRVDPIYRHLLAEEVANGPAGLRLHRFQDGTGYDGEHLLTGTLPDNTLYAVRCLLPASPVRATTSDCQRDIHVGEDLTVLYRFSSRLLDDWQAMDAAVRTYVEDRTRPALSNASSKSQLKSSTGRSS